MTLKIIKSRISKFTITFLLSLLLLAPVSQAKNFDEKINKYQPRIDLDYKWGNERNLGSLNLFIPVLQNSDNLLFIDSRGWLDNNNTKEGNIGLGFRRKINNELLLGAYAFYDAKSTKNDNKFIQGTFGIEALTINWDFRTNLYLAEKDRKNTNSSIVGGIYIQGSNIIDGSQSYETNFDGFDIEVGRKMPFLEDLTMSVSYYHFRNNNVDEKIDGYRARGKYSFFSKNGHSLSLEGQYSYDNLRSDEFLGGIKYSYQFGKSGKDNNRKNQLSAIEKRMTAEVIRDVDIVTKENAADPTTLKSANGEDQKILFVNNEAGGIQEGTMENPFKTLKDAEAASGEYDIIYVYYGDGTTSGYDDGIVLKDYQKLFGQGDDFTIGDVLGNQSYGEVLIAKESDDSYSKITKTFNGGDDTYIEHVTSLSNVETYTIMAANYNVITGVDVSSNNIDDSKLYDYGNGILILNKTGVIINNNKIHDNASHGVYVFNVGLTTSSNTISNNKISDNLQQGIRLIASGSSTQNNNISDNVISDNLGHGISSSSYWLATQNNVISKNLISNNLKRGIHLRSDHN
ncbi:MAG: parallel beta-helix repeat protein, partial [Lentimonas sp.]